MATLPSGVISFLDLQNSLGGSNPIAMNEYTTYIGLGASSTSSHSILSFRGLNLNPTTWPSYLWDTTQSGNFQAGMQHTFTWEPSNSRVKIGYWGYNSGAASAIAYAYSTGWNANLTPEVKCVYSVSSSGISNITPSLSNNTWYSLSSNRTYSWQVNGSSYHSNSLSGNAKFYLRNSLGEISSTNYFYFLTETQGSSGGGPINPK